MSFGKRLKEARGNKRLTQVEVAEILGIDDTTISKYENDKSEPDNETLRSLSVLYGVNIDYLIGKKSKDPTDKLIEYLDVLELTDEEIYDRMTFKVDDMTLTKEEFLEFISFVRYQRSKKKPQPAALSKHEEP